MRASARRPFTPMAKKPKTLWPLLVDCCILRERCRQQERRMLPGMSKRLFQAPTNLETAMAHMYDVIVVGAGPAGSSAAYHLAGYGVDVLLVDRSVFPRDKRCGDAVMPPALEELALMDLVEEVHKRFFATGRIGVWLLGMPGQYQLVGGEPPFQEGLVAPRVDFDALLCEQALSKGAAWLDQVTVHEALCQQEGMMLVRGTRGSRPVELRAQLVIAADGSNSRLARKLREALAGQQGLAIDALTAPYDGRVQFTAMRGYFHGIERLSDALEFYFRGEPGTYYYWIFPLGPHGIANVGVIASMNQLRAEKTNLEAALTAFLQVPELEGRAGHAQLQGQVGAAPIMAGMRGTALFGERLLCVGDAAALVDPRSAEGISGALWSGRKAAETAMMALRHNDYSLSSLSSYGIAVRERYQADYDVRLNQEM